MLLLTDRQCRGSGRAWEGIPGPGRGRGWPQSHPQGSWQIMSPLRAGTVTAPIPGPPHLHTVGAP